MTAPGLVAIVRQIVSKPLSALLAGNALHFEIVRIGPLGMISLANAAIAGRAPLGPMRTGNMSRHFTPLKLSSGGHQPVSDRELRPFAKRLQCVLGIL